RLQGRLLCLGVPGRGGRARSLPGRPAGPSGGRRAPAAGQGRNRVRGRRLGRRGVHPAAVPAQAHQAGRQRTAPAHGGRLRAGDTGAEEDIVQIAIVLYPGFTALDFIGPYESLRWLPDAEVRFVWHEPGPITADSGVLVVAATHAFDETPSPDIILVPGGFST